jgi:hypothetical protein
MMASGICVLGGLQNEPKTMGVTCHLLLTSQGRFGPFHKILHIMEKQTQTIQELLCLI